MTGLQTRRLGRTGLEVSSLGLGTVELGMPYGLGEPQPPADDDCVRLLHQAADRGVTFIDTAAGYGRSETLIGMAFGGRAARPVIATKVALQEAGGRPWTAAELGPGIETAVEQSLRRLRLDALDLLKVHNFTEALTRDAELAEALAAAMGRQIESGRVRHWGASTYGEAAPLAALENPGVPGVVQVAYSVLDRQLETALFPACRERGVGLVLRSVFLKGVLSDRRHSLPPALAPLRTAAGGVAEVATGLGATVPEVALRFALYESDADVTLVGTAALPELEANLAAAEAGPLPADAVAALRRIHVDDTDLLNPGTWPAF